VITTDRLSTRLGFTFLGYREFTLGELTVFYEPRIEDQHVYKAAKYGDMVVELRRRRFSARLLAVEFGSNRLTFRQFTVAL
jgi:hypothetical protein